MDLHFPSTLFPWVLRINLRLQPGEPGMKKPSQGEIQRVVFKELFCLRRIATDFAQQKLETVGAKQCGTPFVSSVVAGAWERLGSPSPLLFPLLLPGIQVRAELPFRGPRSGADHRDPNSLKQMSEMMWDPEPVLLLVKTQRVTWKFGHCGCTR